MDLTHYFLRVLFPDQELDFQGLISRGKSGTDQVTFSRSAARTCLTQLVQQGLITKQVRRYTLKSDQAAMHQAARELGLKGFNLRQDTCYQLTPKGRALAEQLGGSLR